jgi:hypothetical protein
VVYAWWHLVSRNTLPSNGAKCQGWNHVHGVDDDCLGTCVRSSDSSSMDPRVVSILSSKTAESRAICTAVTWRLRWLMFLLAVCRLQLQVVLFKSLYFWALYFGIAVLRRCCSASCNPIAGYRKSTQASVFVYRAPPECWPLSGSPYRNGNAEVRWFARKHEERLLHHDNVEAFQLLDDSELTRRLRRTKPFELV